MRPAVATNPARSVLVAFVSLISIGTALLSLPAAVDGNHPGLIDALFTSASASTVTGLASVDISGFSLFGEIIILILIQVGGFGVMALGAITAFAASHRMDLGARLRAATEFGVTPGEVKGLLIRIAQMTLIVEGGVIIMLFARFVFDSQSVIRSAYSAVFHGISAFNNAGISLYSDSLERYVADPVVMLVVSAAFIVGGLGFPVYLAIARQMLPRSDGHHGPRVFRRPRWSSWSLHTRITLMATAVLLVVGPVVFAIFEWSNPDTLGDRAIGERLLASWFQGTTPRTAGFSTLDIGELNEPTMLFVSTLMFIGAGPASTSGGIKVTTFAVLGFVIWSEVRGRTDVNVFRRRLPRRVIRTAITVALLSVGLVIGTALALIAMTDLTLSPALFEATSAFGTVGLSTGITSDLPRVAHILLVLVMLAGRIGPMTFVAALAMRNRDLPYSYPEERPIIG